MAALFRRRAAGPRPEDGLWTALVAQARAPVFYRDLAVADTPLGRFEMLALHAVLLFRRLKDEGPEGRAVAQAVHNRLFSDLDISLREIGVGDMGIAKRVKTYARNLYGRIAAYDEGLAAGDAVLAAAVRRNVFAGDAAVPEAVVESIAGYVRDVARALSSQGGAGLLAGRVDFGPLPSPQQGGGR
ncbi:MAG: ubiquinol-cytochrome C chaperone [Alphaproteobacteria bacterium]|nr:ubiquinol-cytochrome C chaperone [Alphaproteobacteria bacterium]